MGAQRNGCTIGFVTYGGGLSRVVAITNLDYPGVIVEVNRLSVYTAVPVSSY